MPTVAPTVEVGRFAAARRWTAKLDRVLPPPNVLRADGAPAEMAADARDFGRMARGGSLWRTGAEVRDFVAGTAGALPRAPHFTAVGPAVLQGPAVLANLLGAALGCATRLTLALALALLSLPVAAAVVVVRSLGLGRGAEAPAVLDWTLADAAQAHAFHQRLASALQRKVPPVAPQPVPAFATTQLGRDLARGTFDVAFRHAGSWRAFAPENDARATQQVEAQLRLLTDEDVPWQHQLAAVASQSLANSLLDAFYDGVGWRRVGDNLYAPGEPVPTVAAAHFFQRRDSYHLRLERRRAAQLPQHDGIALTAELAWSPRASAQAWRNACLMERQPSPAPSSFAPAGLRLQLGVTLLRPAAAAPGRLRLCDVRLELAP